MTYLVKKINLLRGMLGGDIAHTGPFYVDIDLTRRCNLSCLGCPYQVPELRVTQPLDDTVLDLSFSDLKTLCFELKQMNTEGLVLQGAGEPMLHPEFLDIVHWTKSLGFHITLLSNGTLLNHRTIKSMVEAKLDVLKVSLWATNTGQYRKNYPRSSTNYFYRVIDGLADVANQKKASNSCYPELFLYYVINRHNYQTIDEVVNLARQGGCNQLYFAIMHNFRDCLNEAALSPEEQKEVFDKLVNVKDKLRSISMGHNIDTLLLRLNTGIQIWDKYPCYVPWFHARIRVDGMVQPCGRCDSTVNFGVLHHQPFSEIWNGYKIRTFRRRVSSPKGLEEMTSHCDCRYCSFLGDIERVHRTYKWFQPLSLANLSK